jgi:hypothetical protein
MYITNNGNKRKSHAKLCITVLGTKVSIRTERCEIDILNEHSRKRGIEPKPPQDY